MLSPCISVNREVIRRRFLTWYGSFYSAFSELRSWGFILLVTPQTPPLSKILWSPNSIGQKHREIVKGCPQYISSVVKCVKLFLPNDFCQKGIKMWICVNEFCNNYCFWVFTVEFLCFVTNWAFVLYHNLRFWVLSQFVLLSCWIKKQLSFVTIQVYKSCGST